MPLRFTIRDLLWLTALLAVLVAWWLDHRKWFGFYGEATDHAASIAKERDALEKEAWKEHSYALRLKQQLDSLRFGKTPQGSPAPLILPTPQQ